MDNAALHAISAWLQPFLLALMCGITGFCAWQLKKWMERIEQDHKIFYSRINNLDQFAAASADDRVRKNAALERLFNAVEACSRRISAEELGNAKRDERIAIVEKRIDYLERVA